MLWVEIILALVIAFVMAAIFVPLLGWRRPGTRAEEGWGAAFLFLFLLLFLATWAGGAWLSPFGPTVWGVHWLGFLLVGIFVMLLIAAVIPPARRSRLPSAEGAEAEAESKAAVIMGVGVFFWIVLTLLVLAIIGAHTFEARWW
jgi:hypothetical protein